MSEKLKPCPFCGMALTYEAPVAYFHPIGKCILSGRNFKTGVIGQWNRRFDLHEAEVARLRAALRNLVGVDCAYDGRNIIIPAVNHGDAIRLVMEARAALAQPPHGAPDPIA